ncbi:MAG TPA: heat-shock protein, partial [Hyphomonas sp.]|nr:heat-shock protein [Hyphomonas sp.]
MRSNNAFGVIKGKTHGCPARDPFSFLQSEIDRLFDSFSGAGFRRPVGMQEVWPRLEVKECDGLIEVAAELPRVDEKNIEVNVTDSRLTIRGEKKPERDEKTKSYRL